MTASRIKRRVVAITIALVATFAVNSAISYAARIEPVLDTAVQSEKSGPQIPTETPKPRSGPQIPTETPKPRSGPQIPTETPKP